MYHPEDEFIARVSRLVLCFSACSFSHPSPSPSSFPSREHSLTLHLTFNSPRPTRTPLPTATPRKRARTSRPTRSASRRRVR